MSSFNVAQIIPSLESGGAERGTIDVSSYLSELKLKNSIISNGGRLINEIISAIAIGYIKYLWYQQNLHGMKPTTSEYTILPIELKTATEIAKFKN